MCRQLLQHGADKLTMREFSLALACAVINWRPFLAENWLDPSGVTIKTCALRSNWLSIDI